MSKKVLFVNRISDSNIGDALSSPKYYFGKEYGDWHDCDIHITEAEIFRTEALRKIDESSLVIIGGGGLLGQKYFEEDLRFFNKISLPKVIWGAGHNSHDIYAIPNHPPTSADYPDFSIYAEYGIRDWNLGHNWLPCVSCMHSEFDQEASIKDGAVYLLHWELKYKPDIVRKITEQDSSGCILFNDDSASTIFRKLRCARVVVTNSYHGAYWGTLLKKPVVVIGGGSKMQTLRHKPVYADHHNWKNTAKSAKIYDDALDQCRSANVDFQRKILLILNSLKH